MDTNTNSKTNPNAQVEIGALWKKSGQTQKFLSGTIKRSAIPAGTDDIQIVVFSNKFKEKDSHPDLRIYISRPKPGSVNDSAPASAPKTASKPASKADPAAPPVEAQPVEEDNGDII